MTDHERFRLLAAEAVLGDLQPEAARELRQHLDGCQTCRLEAAAMARDHQRLVATLAAAPVAPRVRTTVLEAAAGRRRTRVWPLLAAAALLVPTLVGAMLVTGGLPAGPSPRASPSAVASPSPVGSPSPAASPSPVASVSGAYRYTVAPGATRQDSVAVRATDPVSGEWSRFVPDTGRFIGGPVTCLVIDGPDAWMAGPVTDASEGATGVAAFLYVHDGGGPGSGEDLAVTWIADPGQSLETMETWCATRFIPAGPYVVDSGDIAVTPR